MNDVTRVGGSAQAQAAKPGLRLAMIIGGQPGQATECRVDDPDRALRAWSMLCASDQELHQVSVPPGTELRLGRQLQAVAAELERSLSPALTAELQRLLRLSGSEGPTPGELRVEYASVLGWTSGLVVAMLSQLDAAGARRSAQRELEAPAGG